MYIHRSCILYITYATYIFYMYIHYTYMYAMPFRKKKVNSRDTTR